MEITYNTRHIQDKKCTMRSLEKCFKEAYEYDYNFIGLNIKIPNFDSTETIIIPRECFSNKLAYYQKAYSDKLALKTFPDIYITDFSYGNTYDELQNKLLEQI